MHSSSVSHHDRSTLVLSDRDIAAALELPECIAAVERAFLLHGCGELPTPRVLGMHVEGGGFHVKAAAAKLGRHFFAAKINANFPGNPARRGLPTIQGVLVLCDATDGRVLALLDSAEITALRTAAATAVAAKHLAHRDSRVATIVGCGVQGRVQLRALALVLSLEHAFVADAAPGAARQFAAEMSDLLGISISPIGDLAEAAPTTDVWVTCTPSHSPVLRLEHVRPGAFVAGVGADHPEKSELHPDLFGEATVVVDLIEQCLELGDLHHAVLAGAIEPGQVHAELGKIVCGLKPGRSSDSERIVFDSTGTAFQDVAAAEVAYERSLALHRGLEIALSPGQDRAASGHGL